MWPPTGTQYAGINKDQESRWRWRKERKDRKNIDGEVERWRGREIERWEVFLLFFKFIISILAYF